MVIGRKGKYSFEQKALSEKALIEKAKSGDKNLLKCCFMTIIK